MIVDNIIVFDGRTEKRLATLSNKNPETCPFSDAIVVEQLNKDYTFEMKVSATHPDAQHVVRGNLVGFFDLDNNFQVFQIFSSEETNEDGELEKFIQAEHGFYEIADDVVTDLRVVGGPASEAMTKGLSQSRWKAGNVASMGTATLNFYYSNGIKNLQDIANAYGGELSYRFVLSETGITNRFIDLLERRGSDTGKRFEFTKDLKSVKRTVASDGIKTALYGRGKGEEIEDTGGYTRKVTIADAVWSVANGDPVNKPAGQEWVGSPTALTSFGRENGTRHRFGTFDVDSTDPYEVLQLTWEHLQSISVPKVTYELSVMTLEHIAEYEHEKVRLGDTVFVIDRLLGLTIESRVIEIKRDLLNPENTEVVLGNFIDNIADYNSRLEAIETVITDRQSIWDQGGSGGGGEGGGLSEVDDNDIVDAAPQPPSQVAVTGLFKSISLKWDFNASIKIAAYEVFASKVNNFTPDASNRVFRGKTGGYVHEANTDETWYFRIRSVNPAGTFSAFTSQVSGTTVKSTTVDYADLSVTNQKVGELSADKIKFGTLDGNVANIVNINADNIKSGTIAAKHVAIGNTSSFESGFDPRTKATPQDVATAKAEAINAARSNAVLLAEEAREAAKTYAAAQAEASRIEAEAHADGIVSAEEQARINDVNSKLNTAQSYSDQKAEAAKQAAQSYALAQINSVSVGGTNILRDSKLDNITSDKWSYGNTQSHTVIDGAIRITKAATTDRSQLSQNHLQNELFNSRIKTVQDYAISIDVKAISGTAIPAGSTVFLRRTFTDTTANEITLPIPTNLSATEWTRISVVGKFPASTKALHTVAFAIALGGPAGGVFVKNVKLEIGNKATDWSPAPEDTVESINSLHFGGENLFPYLGGTNYDKDGLYPSDRALATIETINGKKWVKFTGAPTLRLLGTPSYTVLVPNETYVYSFYAYTTGNDTDLQIANYSTASYGHTYYKIGKTPTLIEHAFKTNSSGDVLHIQQLNAADTYYFADFQLQRGNRATGYDPALRTLWAYEDTTYIDGGNIYANTVTANQIKAGTITADKLLLGDWTNLFENSTFETTTGVVNTEGWQISTSNWVTAANPVPTSTINSSKHCIRLISRATGNADAYTNVMIPVKAGDVYHFSYHYMFSANSPGRLSIGVRAYDHAGVNMSLWPQTGYTTYAPQTWAKMSGKLVIPAGVGYVQPFVSYQATGAAGHSAYVDNLEMRRAADAELIVDGSITASKINVSSLSAISANIGNVTAGTITGIAITGNTITGGTIKGTTIEGSTVRSSDTTNFWDANFTNRVGMYDGQIFLENRAMGGGLTDMTLNGSGLSMAGDNQFISYPTGVFGTPNASIKYGTFGVQTVAKPNQQSMYYINAARVGLGDSLGEYVIFSGDWYNKIFNINTSKVIMSGTLQVANMANLELRTNGGTPYIDFSSNTSEDYGARIIYNGSGLLQIEKAAVYFGSMIRGWGTWSNTISAGANMAVHSDGTFYRIASAEKYKLCIDPIRNGETLGDNLLNLTPKTWYDKFASEKYAEYLTAKGTDEEWTEDQINAIPLVERHIGFTAEDVERLGLGQFATYGSPDENGHRELEGIQYDRLWIPLVPKIKQQEERIARLEELVASLT